MRSDVCELSPQEASNGAPNVSQDLVNHPKHYSSAGGFEAIKVIEAWKLDFCLGNTVKYIARAGKKADNSELLDLEKAAWYLNRRIEQLKESS